MRLVPNYQFENVETDRKSTVNTPSKRNQRKLNNSTNICFKDKSDTPEKDLIHKFKFDN